MSVRSAMIAVWTNPTKADAMEDGTENETRGGTGDRREAGE